MEPRTDVVTTMLEDGTSLKFEAAILDPEEDVGINTIMEFKEVTNAIEGIASTVMATLKKVKPKKASVEFGITVGLDSGQLTALIVKGTGTSNLKITLQWEE